MEKEVARGTPIDVARNKNALMLNKEYDPACRVLGKVASIPPCALCPVTLRISVQLSIGLSLTSHNGLKPTCEFASFPPFIVLAVLSYGVC